LFCRHFHHLRNFQHRKLFRELVEYSKLSTGSRILTRDFGPEVPAVTSDLRYFGLRLLLSELTIGFY
jgi:hypothetical protein